RAMHSAPTDVLTDTYPEEEYYNDLLRVTGGETTENLARMTIRESEACPAWMQKYGVRFQPSLTGTLHLGRTNAFFLGGGKAVVNQLFAAAERMGVRTLYDTEVVAINLEGDTFKSATATIDGKPVEIRAKALVAACGGFEANLEWLREAWGPPADNFLIRGTPYNTGKVLKSLITQGVKQIGDPKQCHAVAIDARAPKFDGGLVTRLDSVSLGVVLNNQGKRFYDEGEDFWPKRYAVWGRIIAGQPDQIGYSIIDAKAIGKFMPSVFPPIKAQSIRELADKLGIPADAAQATVDEYNRAIEPGGTFDHQVLDNCRTQGLQPDKTHWARPIDTAPFIGYPLRPGITFTYLSVVIDDRANMQMADGRPSKNMFAAGEIMSGNVLGKGYLAGIGMTIGTVFGRVAGREAGKYVVGH
ncbi:MAG: FAD-dependent tricarballylate dehydrogenase TcuA, partial [Burkholderiales bacterium]